jgi:SSS family solute:Na+ symporter
MDPIHIDNTFHTFIIVCWETLRHNSLIFGFVIAALTAALMSTIDTLINACAAIGIYDIYKPLFRPEADDRHYLKAARWASGIATVVGVLLVILFNNMKGSLMSIHYKGIMIIIPSIVTTIFLGAFWRRFTAKAACISMITGSILTVLTVQMNIFGHPVGWPEWIKPLAKFVGAPDNGIYIYTRALFGMTVTAIVGIIVSLLTKKQSREKLVGLTVDTLDEAMAAYKGGTPNHAVGEKIRALSVVLDEALPVNQVALASSVMERMKADPGDMIYVADSRWFLGGLRSSHVKAAPPHDDKAGTVRMSKATFDDAYLLEGRPVSLEKIF